MNQDDSKNLNTLWKNSALEDFIRRMLAYFDPMNLVVLGAPQDEYDADIPKIMDKILLTGVTIDDLSDYIFNLYKDSTSDINEVKKKSQRMAKDLFELKKS